MRYYVAGHRGMVGGAILRRLQARAAAGAPIELITRTSAELDLRDQGAVRDFMQDARPDQVILAAAKVGGIHANNTYPAEFIYENLMIECNVIHQAHAAGVDRLLQLGSSCIYPREAAQPMAEDALLTGVLEPTNEPYAIAKIAGIKMCQSYNRQYRTNFISLMPTNLYGPGDNFDLETSHVLPALIRKFHEAKLAGTCVTLWGTGSPMREFLHVDDLADAFISTASNAGRQLNSLSRWKKAVNELGTLELKEALQSLGIGNHPAFVRMYAQMGMVMKRLEVALDDDNIDYGKMSVEVDDA